MEQLRNFFLISHIIQ